MILCLDIGNTHIHGGVFDENKLILQFRKTTRPIASSDEYGLFLRGVLKENRLSSESIKMISMCSVVPDAIYSIRSACIKYFDINPFQLQAGTRTGLKIKYNNPQDVGADRIANAIAGIELFPDKNFIIIDFGTATTFCVVSKKKEYLGGIILPGLRISMETLQQKTAKLKSVEIKVCDHVVGKTTTESIQSGLYFGHIGIINELKDRIAKEVFRGDIPFAVGTGGFSGLFEDTNLLDVIVPDLALQGLYKALKLNS